MTPNRLLKTRRSVRASSGSFATLKMTLSNKVFFKSLLGYFSSFGVFILTLGF